MGFSAIPTIKKIEFSGLWTIIAPAFEATTPENIKMGVGFDGVVGVKTTMSREISQPKRRWWQPCWTDILRPQRCNSKVVDIELNVAISKSSISTNLLLAALQCPPDAPARTCNDVTAEDLVTAALTRNLDGIKESFLLRMRTLSITEVTAGFQKIEDLNVNLDNSGPLMNAIVDLMASFNKNRLNEKGEKYETTIGNLEKAIQTVGEKYIEAKMQPSFGGICYMA